MAIVMSTEYPDPPLEHVVLLERLTPGIPEQKMPSEELKPKGQCDPHAADAPCLTAGPGTNPPDREARQQEDEHRQHESADGSSGKDTRRRDEQSFSEGAVDGRDSEHHEPYDERTSHHRAASMINSLCWFNLCSRPTIEPIQLTRSLSTQSEVIDLRDTARNRLVVPLRRSDEQGPLRRRQRIGGMLNYYYRAA
jgi:hypothetical protein